MDVNAVKQILCQDNHVASVADSHGMICGVLCAAPIDGNAQLFESFKQLAAEGILPEKYMQLLSYLIQETERQLETQDFTFQLALADDEQSVAQQCGALSSWCQSFLLGIRLCVDERQYRGDIREALQDIAKISSQLFELENFEGDDEDNESDFIEIVEYVRIAVLMIREENKHELTQVSYTARQLN